MHKRLGSYPRQPGLSLAMREIGRIERTLWTLEWLESPPMRRQTTAELNKGESRNALARAVAFHRLGRLRDRTVALLQHRASALALVTGRSHVEHRVLWPRIGSIARPGRGHPGRAAGAPSPRPAGSTSTSRATTSGARTEA